MTDFGSSVMPEEMYARTRENGGTILYSAPEFAGVTRRERQAGEYFLGDVYSLGVLLYHLVTARLPHDTLSQVVRHAPFPRPREINTSVCPALEDFILRCLPLDPSSRWQTVSEMLSVSTPQSKFRGRPGHWSRIRGSSRTGEGGRGRRQELAGGQRNPIGHGRSRSWFRRYAAFERRHRQGQDRIAR